MLIEPLQKKVGECNLMHMLGKFSHAFDVLVAKNNELDIKGKDIPLNHHATYFIDSYFIAIRSFTTDKRNSKKKVVGKQQ